MGSVSKTSVKDSTPCTPVIYDKNQSNNFFVDLRKKSLLLRAKENIANTGGVSFNVTETSFMKPTGETHHHKRQKTATGCLPNN